MQQWIKNNDKSVEFCYIKSQKCMNLNKLINKNTDHCRLKAHNNNRVSLKMKYHEKLNLKSPIFKYSNTNTSRTPTKSPIRPSVSPSDLFQKVCCPNCKYAFKIIRNQVLKDSPIEVATPTKKKSVIKEKKQVQTQTDYISTPTNFNSPSKASKSPIKLSPTLKYNATQNYEDYRNSRLNQILQPSNTQSKLLRETEFKFKPLSVSPHNKINTSKNLLKTLDPKAYKILSSEPIETRQSYKQNSFVEPKSPAKSNLMLSLNDSINYERQNVGQYELSSPRKSSEKLQEPHVKFVGVEPVETDEGMNKFRKRLSSKPQVSVANNQINFLQNSSTWNVESNPNKNKSCCRCQNKADLQKLIREMIVKNEQNQIIIHQLRQFCKDACEEVEVPSFCKMLCLAE